MKNTDDLENEVWVKHPIGIMVSNLGRVWTARNGKWYGGKNGTPYLQVKWRGKAHSVHRLICETFKENPDNLPTVDHIDRNPLNNRADNLRWADMKLQSNNREVDYKSFQAKRIANTDFKAKVSNTDWKSKVSHTDYKAIAEKRSIPILQLNKDTFEVIKEWKSASEAQREGGYCHSHINDCLKGRRKYHNGFIWQYKNNGEVN